MASGQFVTKVEYVKDADTGKIYEKKEALDPKTGKSVFSNYKETGMTEQQAISKMERSSREHLAEKYPEAGILPKGSWSEQQEAKRRASERTPWTVTEVVRQTKPTSQEVSRRVVGRTDLRTGEFVGEDQIEYTTEMVRSEKPSTDIAGGFVEGASRFAGDIVGVGGAVVGGVISSGGKAISKAVSGDPAGALLSVGNDMVSAGSFMALNAIDLFQRGAEGWQLFYDYGFKEEMTGEKWARVGRVVAEELAYETSAYFTFRATKILAKVTKNIVVNTARYGEDVLAGKVAKLEAYLEKGVKTTQTPAGSVPVLKTIDGQTLSAYALQVTEETATKPLMYDTIKRLNDYLQPRAEARQITEFMAGKTGSFRNWASVYDDMMGKGGLKGMDPTYYAMKKLEEAGYGGIPAWQISKEAHYFYKPSDIIKYSKEAVERAVKEHGLKRGSAMVTFAVPTISTSHVRMWADTGVKYMSQLGMDKLSSAWRGATTSTLSPLEYGAGLSLARVGQKQESAQLVKTMTATITKTQDLTTTKVAQDYKSQMKTLDLTPTLTVEKTKTEEATIIRTWTIPIEIFKTPEPPRSYPPAPPIPPIPYGFGGEGIPKFSIPKMMLPSPMKRKTSPQRTRQTTKGRYPSLLGLVSGKKVKTAPKFDIDIRYPTKDITAEQRKILGSFSTTKRLKSRRSFKWK